MSEPEITVVRHAAWMPCSPEMLADAQGTQRAMEAWMAMTPEERAAVAAKRDVEQMAAKAAAEAEARRFLDWLRARLDAVERMATHSEHYCDCRDLGCEDDEVRDAAVAAVTAHREIIDEHQPIDGWIYDGVKLCGTCATAGRDGDLEGDPYPCVTLRALAKAYGWMAEPVPVPASGESNPESC